jgi:hypothetical protein
VTELQDKLDRERSIGFNAGYEAGFREGKREVYKELGCTCLAKEDEVHLSMCPISKIKEIK